LGHGRTIYDANTTALTPVLLSDIKVVSDDDAFDSGSVAQGHQKGSVEVTEEEEEEEEEEAGAVAGASSHYSDPDTGCLDDEETILAASGRVCAPRIGKLAKSGEEAGVPTPACKLGGSVRDKHNGCPAGPKAHGKAFPVCLAKGNATNPYSAGMFHCLLVCPCKGKGTDCGKAAHASCPGKSKCERGELRNMAQGVCTYHGA